MDNLTEQKIDLSTVKRLADELSRAISSAAAQKNVSKTPASERDQNSDNHNGLSRNARFIWLFACLVSLAGRGLIPANLKNGKEDKAIKKLGKQFFGITQFQQDDSPMACAVGTVILFQKFADEDFDAFLDVASSTLLAIKSGSSKNGIERAMTDPLFAGWVYQYLLQLSEKEWKKSGVSHEKTGDSPFYTKWFTPLWIADFLAEDAIKTPGATFLDPACGAGHILVPSLKRSVRLLTESGYTPDAALQTAVEKLIFGLEIDADLSAASAVSLYLAARDIDATTSLSAANLYAVVEQTKDSACTASLGGSLCLGLETTTKQTTSTFLKQVGKDDLIPLQTLPTHFGAIAANPPYMSMRNMPAALSEFLKHHYPLSKYDLYSAFVELSVNLLEEGARASLICQQSVLSISRYKPLRELISEKCSIDTLIQLGSGSFPTRSGEKVNNAIITLRRVSQQTPAGAAQPFYFARILYSEEKKQAEHSGIRSILETRQSQAVMPKSESKTILAPWCPPFVHNLFDKDRYDRLQNGSTGIVVINGLFTCNNKLFVKTIDEIAADKMSEYVPYDKGGGGKWFHTTRYRLHWVDSGNVIREYRASRGQSRSLPGEDYYFKAGITYSYIGTQGFKARLLSPESIFDIASSSIFTPDNLKMYMLGFMNAALVRYLMGVLNPTINFQIGDVRNLPYAMPDSSTQFAVSKLADEAVNLAKAVEKFDFEHPSLETDEFLSWARAKERVIQSDIDSLIFSLYKVPPKVQKQILNDPWVVRGQKNVFAAAPKGRRAPAVIQT